MNQLLVHSRHAHSLLMDCLTSSLPFTCHFREDVPYDFLINNSQYVLVSHITQLSTASQKQQLLARVRSTRAGSTSGGDQLYLFIVVDAEEPSLDMLTWVNVEVGLALRVKVVLTWTVEELLCMLDGISRFQHAGGDVEVPRLSGEADRTSVLVEAFTLSPQIVSRLDIIRIANRCCGTVAEFLSLPVDEMAKANCVGGKKATKLYQVLNAPFLPALSIRDVVGGSHRRDGSAGEARADADPTSTSMINSIPAEAQASDAVSAMKEALRRIRMQEDEEEDERVIGTAVKSFLPN